jgi:DNA-binding response OmpR family regulator
MSPARVLLVDDSLYVRARLSSALRSKGFDPLSVATSAEALACDLPSVAAAVLDVELGEESGVALARELRLRAPIRVAFMTSNVTAATEQSADVLGPVFTKDWDLAPLLAWLLAEGGAPIPGPGR